MSGQEPSTNRVDVSSPQPTIANRDILGDHSGNSGSHNITNSGNTNSGNTTNYFGTNPPLTESETLRCLYTSQYQSHRGRVREPAEGTCTWVTDHPKYKEWLGKSTSGICWLSADPGCGKSVTASFLITDLSTHTDATICYFFFKDDCEEQNSATFALSAILHQLFSQQNTLCKYAEGAFRHKGDSITEEVYVLWDILVQAVAEGGCGEVICVVDALDECEERTLAQFIHCLTARPRVATLRLLTPRPLTPDVPLKLLITARPYHRIERELGPLATMIRLRGEDELSAISADVTRVIDEGIKNLESYWQHPGGLGYLRELLESSADRTFLWVSLVLESLKDTVDVSRAGFTNLVSTVPRDLAGFYTKILDKSPSPDQARRILHIVVAAARPLTLREINIAFRVTRDTMTVKDIDGMSPQGEAAVKNMCGLFVRIIDSKVYLVHQTAREFLVKGSLVGCGNWQYTLRPMDSSFILTEICISYLLLQEFEKDPLLTGTVVTPETGAVKSYVQKYGFLDYAASHWTNHLRELKDGQMGLFEPVAQICRRGSNRALTWLRVYWENDGQRHPFPRDFTHLMIASWFGQQSIVQRLLEERESINIRSEIYGTALNIAGLRGDKDTIRMLVNGRVNAYLNGKEYNILLTRKNELYREIMDYYWVEDKEKGGYKHSGNDSGYYNMIASLIPFSIHGIQDLHTMPNRLISSRIGGPGCLCLSY